MNTSGATGRAGTAPGRVLKKKHGFFNPFRKDTVEGYLMAAPFVILFTVFVVIPVIWSLVLSLTSYNIIQPMKFIGLENYKELFTNDDLFIKAVKNTFSYAVVAGPLGFIASFLFAWIINQLKFRNTFALAFYAPSLTSGLAMSVVWLYLFSSDRYGLVNDILIRLGFLSEPVQWTKDPQYIMKLIIFISLWTSMGTGFLTNLAGLNNIPKDMYEAGKIDGIRNKFQELWYITLPSVKPQLLFNSIMAMVGALGVFDITVGIAGFPSPDYAAHTMVGHMYDYAFLRFELGYASAISFLLFLLNFGLGRILMKIFSSKDE